MNTLLLIDGSNLLFQMFFGMPARIINRDGKAIQGVLGFTGALIKIIKRTNPSHLAVMFDGEHENARTALDEAYKANRPDYSSVPEEENPYSQLQDVYNALDFLGMKHVETTALEADDLIASYAIQYGSEMEIVISSFDSDFFQLICNRVKVLRYRGEKTTLCDVNFFQEKFGISPAHYADWKAMVGDRSDNIKGAEKIGPKTATALICEYGSLDNIIANAGKIPKPSVRESIQRNAQRLYRNYKLIKLDGAATVPFALDTLTYAYNGISTHEVLAGIGLR